MSSSSPLSLLDPRKAEKYQKTKRSMSSERFPTRWSHHPQKCLGKISHDSSHMLWVMITGKGHCVLLGVLYVFICFSLVFYVWWVVICFDLTPQKMAGKQNTSARLVSVMKFKHLDIELVVVLKMQAWHMARIESEVQLEMAQGGPLLVINWVTTPISGLLSG